MLDAQGRRPDASVLDNPHQLCQRGRPVPRAAQRGRKRRHQVIEGIAQLGPALMDIEESLDFQHGTDPRITGAAVASLEQPAVDLLTLVAAGSHGIGEGCLIKLLEVGE